MKPSYFKIAAFIFIKVFLASIVAFGVKDALSADNEGMAEIIYRSIVFSAIFAITFSSGQYSSSQLCIDNGKLKYVRPISSRAAPAIDMNAPYSIKNGFYAVTIDQGKTKFRLIKHHYNRKDIEDLVSILRSA